jgi:hypothetical protein
MIDPRQRFAFLELVLARSLSVEQAARRYDCHPRTIRRWCWMAPISCRIAGPVVVAGVVKVLVSNHR